MWLLCRELVKEPGVELRLFTKRRSTLAARAAASGVQVLPTWWAFGIDPLAIWRLRRAIRRLQPHIVHAHDSHGLAVAGGAIGSLLGGSSGFSTPSLVATRRVDFHIPRRSPWRLTDRIIAISEAVRRVLLADGISPHSIAVVPDGIDADEVRRAAARPLNIRARLGLPDGTPLAVNVAALVDHKDQRTLIRAAHHARSRRPDLHWAIAGEGKLRRSLAAEIAGLDLGDRVHLLGYVDAADALIREGNVFVMSSKEEGLGSVILNALALDKPVVATRGGGIPEIVPPECVVPVGDAAALAEKVLAALDDPSLVPLPARCTAAAMARGVLAVYRSLI